MLRGMLGEEPFWAGIRLYADRHKDRAVETVDLRRALEEPTRRIAINAGKDGSVIVQEVKRLKKGDGYDALRDQFGNMEKKGIIDPLKVTRAALENAVSIAGLVLTTNCLVADLPEKKDGAAGAAPPMPPMY